MEIVRVPITFLIAPNNQGKVILKPGHFIVFFVDDSREVSESFQR